MQQNQSDNPTEIIERLRAQLAAAERERDEAQTERERMCSLFDFNYAELQNRERACRTFEQSVARLEAALRQALQAWDFVEPIMQQVAARPYGLQADSHKSALWLIDRAREALAGAEKGGGE